MDGAAGAEESFIADVSTASKLGPSPFSHRPWLALSAYDQGQMGTDTQTFKRPRRRAVVELPPAKVQPFTAPLVGLTGYGQTIVAKFRNKAVAGHRIDILVRRITQTNQHGVTFDRQVYDLVVGGTVMATYRNREEAVAAAQQQLEERDYGGYRSVNNETEVVVYGRKGGPRIPQVKLVVNDGAAVVADGERVVGTLPGSHQRLIVQALRAGTALQAVLQLGMRDTPLLVAVRPD